jgi:hypothetical protein
MKTFKISLILLFSILFFSCGSLKNRTKTKTETEKKEQREIIEYETKIVKREKDSVVWKTIPNYEYRDTTIVKRGKTTTLKLDFNSTGQLEKADCTADAIEELTQTVRKLNERINTLTNEKNKESVFDPEIFKMLLIFLGFMITIIILLFILLKKYSK